MCERKITPSFTGNLLINRNFPFMTAKLILLDRTYDEERHFKRMAAAGVFQSVKPDTPAPQWLTDYEQEVDKAIAALKK
jgi:hypothetical protein